MNNEIKEIYLLNSKWTKIHNNMGSVMANIVFKNDMSYEEYNKLFKSSYFIICDKDYITNLQEENKELNDDNIWWNNRFKAVERDNRNLKAKLEMYENGVYFSSENDELQQKIDKAIEELDKYINSCEIEAEHTLNNEKCLRSVNHSKKVKNILQGSDKE